MSGLEVLQIPSDARGNVDLNALKAICDETVVGLMLTNPNTLGLFDEHIEEIIQAVHACGGLVYGDGANLNALLGIVRPGDLGFDLMHFNLHKTFSTPHGGGGPGSGPVGVSERLADFLPAPIVGMIEEAKDEPACHCWASSPPKNTIGRVKAFHGHFGMFVRAYTYIAMHGADGLRQISRICRLECQLPQGACEGHLYHVPFDRICMHEFVAEGQWADAPGIRALDVAKRLMDYDFHPPTNYFPAHRA